VLTNGYDAIYSLEQVPQEQHIRLIPCFYPVDLKKERGMVIIFTMMARGKRFICPQTISLNPLFRRTVRSTWNTYFTLLFKAVVI